MAAYAALLSLMHTIDQIRLHPHPPISLDEKQVESLNEKVNFLQEFLEGYSLHHVGYNKEPDALEMCIADAAYAAEDIIESLLVDQILVGSTSHGKMISSINDFYQKLQKVIEDMDLISKEDTEIKKKMEVQGKLQRYSASAGSFRSSSTRQNTMVGFDDVLLEVLDKLTGGQLHRQIIPIVGMGGIGKTTLARNVYQNQVVVQHFDILMWVTISQEYRMREIIVELLQEDRENLSQMDECELGDKLHKKLSGRRYLIILDDIWDIEVWDQLKFFFPDNNNGSRIMFTTRLSNLASQVAYSDHVDMSFLDGDNSWNLFSKTVFGEDACPIELEEIGRNIVKNCKGLPLSIVVIGGLLAKSEHTQEYWEYIGENLNSVVNLDDNESCLKILYMSYSMLPVYLKPCFLYMGVFKEDSAIRVSTLIKLWVAEGFLKPINGKCLEEIAKDYLKELINRNLILVQKLGSTGNIKFCNIHDLLRDFCLREAQKERFYSVTRKHSLNLPQSHKCHIGFPNSTSKNIEDIDDLLSMSLVRSLVHKFEPLMLPSCNSRLLRMLEISDSWYWIYENEFFLPQLFNSRYILVRDGSVTKSSPPLQFLWNLHTLIVDNNHLITRAPFEIWKMPQLRHVKFCEGFYLADPPSRDNIGRGDDIVLENLKTLMEIRNFKCNEEVIKRIPNIKKLGICIESVGSSDNYLNNLDRLCKLESLACKSFLTPEPGGSAFSQKLSFPQSLKKLTLEAFHVHWEDMMEKIGSLPHLEKLKLIKGSFKGRKWETVEGQFSNLRFLLFHNCKDLEYWTTESSHFPRLEHLVLEGLIKLKEIPSEIGEIPTLKSIDLRSPCSNSAIISAKKILEEQEDLLGDQVALQVRVQSWEKKEELASLASPNFQFI